MRGATLACALLAARPAWGQPADPMTPPGAEAPTPAAGEAEVDGDEAAVDGDQAEVDEAEATVDGDDADDAAEDLEGQDDEDDTMTVLGRREQLARVSGSAHVVGADTLETFERDDIERVLVEVPGVYLRAEDGYGLRPNIGLRGASSDRSAKVTLMEDGVLLGPAPYAAPAAYYFPLTTRMTRVEVFKGPAAIQHGPNTIGGAINLTTRPVPRRQKGALDVALGTDGAAKTHGWFGETWGPFGLLVEGVRLESDGFKRLDGGGDTGFVKHETMLKLAYESGAGGGAYQRWQLKLGYADEVSNETYLGLTDADFDRTPYRRYAASALGRMDWWRTQIQFDYDLVPTPSLEFTLTAYRHDMNRVWRKVNAFRGASVDDVLRNPDDLQLAVFLDILRGDLDSEGRAQTLLIGANDRSYVSNGVQVRGSWSAGAGPVDSRLEIGARVHADQIERDHTERGYLMRSGALLPDGQPEMTTAANRGSALAFAAHVLDELQIGDDLFLTPGGRLEVVRTRLEDRGDDPAPDAEQTDTVLLGGLGLYYQALPWVGVLAGVHQGFSPVAPGQPEAVEPERSVNYEAGLRLAQGDALRAEAIGFFNDYSNLTAQCTFSQGCDPDDLDRQLNAGAVDVYGVEASARYGLPLGVADLTLNLGLTYTFTASRFGADFQSINPQLGEVEEGDALPYVPRHQGSGRVGVEGPRFGVDVLVGFVGEMRDVAGTGSIPDDERIDAHTVVDAAAFFAFTAANRLYVTTDNVLDTAYPVSRRPFGLRPGKPFALMVGYKHAFGR